MKILRPIAVLALILLLIETFCLIIIPEAPTQELNEAMSEAVYKEYFIIQVTIFSCSFIAFFAGLFALIISILRATLKENAIGLALLLVSFLIPIILYYA